MLRIAKVLACTVALLAVWIGALTAGLPRRTHQTVFWVSLNGYMLVTRRKRSQDSTMLACCPDQVSRKHCVRTAACTWLFEICSLLAVQNVYGVRCRLPLLLSLPLGSTPLPLCCTASSHSATALRRRPACARWPCASNRDLILQSEHELLHVSGLTC